MTQAEEVRAAADIVKVVGDYVKLSKAGVNMRGLCPFHHEKTPSFAVHPVKQIFHCFGCGVGGDVFKFVMLIENLTFPEALRRVAEKAGVKLKERPFDAASDASGRERETLQKIHDVATRFFATQLGATVEGRAARAYLADRGLSDETVARFRIGYAPSEGHALLRHLESAGFSPEVMEKSGLVLAEAEGRHRLDRFRRRIIFPIARENGSVVAFGGRALGEDQPKYLNSPETPIYTKSRVLFHLDRAARAIRKTDEAILVEGYMDAIAVASAGFEQVVASCGTSLTASQVRLLARHTRLVVVNYDPDSAGLAATERSLELLLEEGFGCRVLALPGGLDPDAFIRKQGASAYGERLKSAPNYLEYLADRAAAAHGLRMPQDKVAAANAVLPYVIRMPNPLVRTEWADRLAYLFRISDRELREEIKQAAIQRHGLRAYGGSKRMGDSFAQYLAHGTSKGLDSRMYGEQNLATQDATRALGVPQMLQAEKELLRTCLENEALADELLPGLAKEGVLDALASSNVFRAIIELRGRGEKLDLSQIEESLTAAEQLLVYECQFASADPASRDAALACSETLRRKKLESQLPELEAAIRLATEKGAGKDQLFALGQAKLEITKRVAQLRRAELLRTKSKLAGQLGHHSRS